MRVESLLRYTSGQVVEAQAGEGFPNKDMEYAKTLAEALGTQEHKPHAPAPVDRYVSLALSLSCAHVFTDELLCVCVCVCVCVCTEGSWPATSSTKGHTTWGRCRKEARRGVSTQSILSNRVYYNILCFNTLLVKTHVELGQQSQFASVCINLSSLTFLNST